MDKLPFIPNQVYNRRADIHTKYGGSWQSGISPSKEFPYIFIFTGKSGKYHGYEDGWDNPNVFSYTGEGQIGDMKFVRGNLALRDHLKNGKRVFLFEFVSDGFVKFISEVIVFESNYAELIDTKGDLRDGIKFLFHKVGVKIPDSYKQLSQKTLNVSEPIDLNSIIPNVTERSGLVNSRIGQGMYRNRILHRWEYQCAVTGFDNLKILIASHIVPWKDSNNAERIDPNNGILLSPVYDALFDRHLISFENNGKIILSDQIEIDAYIKIGVSGKERIKKLSEKNHLYLERHRTKFIS